MVDQVNHDRVRLDTRCISLILQTPLFLLRQAVDAEPSSAALQELHTHVQNRRSRRQARLDPLLWLRQIGPSMQTARFIFPAARRILHAFAELFQIVGKPRRDLTVGQWEPIVVGQTLNFGFRSRNTLLPRSN